MRNIRWCFTVLAASAALAAKGASDMPMLNWMGREKAVKATKDVVMKILREEKSLGKCCQCGNVANLNYQFQFDCHRFAPGSIDNWQH